MGRTLSTAGASILYNAVVVVAGFLVLSMSGFSPNRVLGYLVSLSVAVCFATTATTLAALVHLAQPDFVRGSPEAEDDDAVADAETV